ncbi:MAG: hypothetical protein ACI93G_001383 [Hyphomonas sp.]|jgi:hypothetical protein
MITISGNGSDGWLVPRTAHCNIGNQVSVATTKKRSIWSPSGMRPAVSNSSRAPDMPARSRPHDPPQIWIRRAVIIAPEDRSNQQKVMIHAREITLQEISADIAYASGKAWGCLTCRRAHRTALRQMAAAVHRYPAERRQGLPIPQQAESGRDLPGRDCRATGARHRGVCARRSGRACGAPTGQHGRAPAARPASPAGS